jgi:hypothetical protein
MIASSEDRVSAESVEPKKAKPTPTPIAKGFSASMLEAFTNVVGSRDNHTFVAGGELETEIRNNLPHKCLVLPADDPTLLTDEATNIVHVTSLELLDAPTQFKEINTLYDTFWNQVAALQQSSLWLLTCLQHLPKN